jgi:hypothetical protein
MPDFLPLHSRAFRGKPRNGLLGYRSTPLFQHTRLLWRHRQ